MAITEIILPNAFQEVAFTSIAEQVPGITINLPDKIFAVPEYGIEINTTRAAELYTHWQLGISDGAANSKKWDTVRWYPGNTAADVASSIPNDPNFVVMLEILENRINAGMTGNGAFLADVMQRIFTNTGQADPANTNIVGDYYDGDGMGQSGIVALKSAPGASFWTNWKQRFVSESEARKDRDGVTSSFFSDGKYEYRNFMVGGYLDGWHRIPEHTHIYHLIAELEQKALSIRRKKIQFCWDVLEGSEWKIYRQGSLQAIRFENPAGNIYKSTLNGVPPEIMFRQGVVNSMIGDGMINWGAAARTKHDIARWIRSYNGGFVTSKTKWKKDGTSLVVDYNPNDPTMPAKSPGDNPNNYTENNVQIVPPNFYGPAPYGIHDALGGRWAAAQVASKNTSLRWASGSTYKINGGSANNMYPGGTSPVMGVLGNATISTLNNRNFEQDNIVRQLEYKKPIHLVAGVPGNGLILWCNPLARPAEVNEVTFTESGSHTFTAVGPRMRLFNW